MAAFQETTMKTSARWKRTLHFVAGPQVSTFFACDPCKPALETAWPDPLFFATATAPVAALTDLEIEDGHDCDLCREP
jgi:hypothetical protein